MLEENQEQEQQDMSGEDMGFVSEVLTKYEMLESDTNVRLDRYRLYKEFTEGNQWVRIPDTKEDGREKITHNLCDQTVRKYTALLMGEAPQIVVPRQSEIEPTFDLPALKKKPETSDDELAKFQEFDRSDAIEKILRKAFFIDNNGAKLMNDGAFNDAELGDAVMYVYWDKEKKQPKIENIFPGHARISFGTNDFQDIEYAFIDEVMSIEEIERKYNFIAGVDEIDFTTWDPQQFREKPSAMVHHYWDMDSYAIVINNKLVKKEKNSYGRIPLFLIPNLTNGREPWGVSDLHSILSLQESYNKALSDEANLSKIYAEPKIMIKNPGKTNLDNFKQPGGRIIPISKDADVGPLQFTGQLPPLLNRIDRIKGDYHDISGLPPIAFGSAQGSIVTGVALTAQFSPVLQQIRAKMSNWDVQLRVMAEFILELYEKFGGNYADTKVSYKQIINGWRYTEWQWGQKTPRDDSIYIQNELNKMNTRVQSRYRTMTNLGIQAPNDELQQIGLEETNPTLNPKQAIEKQLADAQTGEGKEPQMVELAESENQQMGQGQEVPPVGKNAKEHEIHLTVHEAFINNNPDLPPEAIEALDTHMAGHEQILAAGGGQGGIRAGAGRPEENPNQASSIPALAATGELPIGTPPETQ